MIARRLLLVLCVLVLTACSSGPSDTPSPSLRAFPSLPALPTPGPSISVALPTPTLPPVACAFTSQTSVVFSDRLTNATFEVGPASDTISFLFDPPSASRPQGPASLAVAAVNPPFTQDGSGAPVDVAGDRHLQLRFSGMTVEAYAGATLLDTEGTSQALQQAVLTGNFEGVITFVVGYNSLPCPTLNVTNEQIDLVLPH